MEALVYTVLGIAVGGLIIFLVSRHYYQRASEDLQTEAEELRQETREARDYVNALISYLESAGQIRVTRDQEGRPIQVQILQGGGIASSRSSAYAVPTLTYPENQNRTDAPQEAEDADERPPAQEEEQARSDSTEEAKGE
jgi:hypothetical protein